MWIYVVLWLLMGISNACVNLAFATTWDLFWERTVFFSVGSASGIVAVILLNPCRYVCEDPPDWVKKELDNN